MRRKQTEALSQIAGLISAELGVDRVIEKIIKASKLVVSGVWQLCFRRCACVRWR